MLNDRTSAALRTTQRLPSHSTYCLCTSESTLGVKCEISEGGRLVVQRPMGKCLSRWCEESDSDEPVGNGHTSAGKNGSLHGLSDAACNVASHSQIHLDSTTPGFHTPNTPRSVHVTVPSFVVGQNGSDTASVCMPRPVSRPDLNGGDKVMTSDTDAEELNMFFDEYRDPSDDNCILIDGVERLCQDLDVKPDDFVVLVLAWRFAATAMCRFTRSEFVTGCRQLGVRSLPSLRDRLFSVADSVVDDRVRYRELYRWAYRFALDPGAGHRTLPADTAVAMWRVVFAVPSSTASAHGIPPSASWAMPLWLEFLEHNGATVRGITRDTWDMLLNFLESLVDSSMSTYDETEAWPSLFDDFVKWVHDRHRRPSTDLASSPDLDQPTKIDSC